MPPRKISPNYEENSNHSNGQSFELIAEGKLRLCSTQIVIVYAAGGFPYHIHRKDVCHGGAVTLDAAKTGCWMVLHDLLEMGIDP